MKAEQLKNNGDLTIAEFCALRESCKGKTEGQVVFMLSYFVSASQINTLSRALNCDSDTHSVATALMQL